MTDRGVVEVYRAKSGFQAHQFMTALEEAGIKAEVQGSTIHSPTVTAANLLGGGAVWWDAPRILVYAEDAERAKTLLLELEARERSEAEKAGAAETIPVVCEECEQTSQFPATKRGSVQECPQCGAFLDVGEDEEAAEWGADPGSEREE